MSPYRPSLLTIEQGGEGMTDKECLWHLKNMKLFCSVQQALAVDRAAQLLAQQIKAEEEKEKSPLP